MYSWGCVHLYVLGGCEKKLVVNLALCCLAFGGFCNRAYSSTKKVNKDRSQMNLSGFNTRKRVCYHSVMKCNTILLLSLLVRIMHRYYA